MFSLNQECNGPQLEDKSVRVTAGRIKDVIRSYQGCHQVYQYTKRVLYITLPESLQ